MEKVAEYFNPNISTPVVQPQPFNPDFSNPNPYGVEVFMVESLGLKVGVEKFRVEKSGVEMFCNPLEKLLHFN